MKNNKKILIQAENIKKSFNGKEVLKGLNLTIYEGELFVIMGPSGCGKSVLLKHILGLLKPDSGEIIFKGTNITNLNLVQLNNMRKNFGMLFQGAALFDSLTVGENIAFGLRQHKNLSKDIIHKKIKEKLELVGMPGIENLKPSELSGGMKKRVGLARAIAMEPEVILYDEPTTGLDPVMVTVIDDLIKSLQQKLNVTSIVVTHDMRSAYEIADRIGMHYNGKILEIGTVEDIKTSGNPYVKQFIHGLMEGPIKTK